MQMAAFALVLDMSFRLVLHAFGNDIQSAMCMEYGIIQSCLCCLLLKLKFPVAHRLPLAGSPAVHLQGRKV